MDFVTIDFETATSERNSPCELGITIVKEGQITETLSWLIKPKHYPYFDSFNIAIHGIYPEHVANSPEFDEVWQDVRPRIENQLVIAHNASFDFSVLRNTLATYNIPFPNLDYACSYILAKKVWKGLAAYDLKSLCNHNNISLNHHRAAADSRACADLIIKALKETETTSVFDLSEQLTISIGKLFDGGYKPAKSNKDLSTKELANLVGDPTKHNIDSIFFGKSIAFTGTLSSMPRATAQQLIADIGGVNAKSVNKHTDFLVVGQQDYRVVGEDGMSSKQEKAIQLINKGSSLEIISEQVFLCSI